MTTSANSRQSALVPVDRDIWIADGPEVSFFGFPYPTRMTIVRLGDSSLCSPIALGEPLAQAVEALGTPRHLVAPNTLHHLFLGDWQRRWPAAGLYAAPGLARRRRDLTFTAELGDHPPPAWAAEIDQVAFRGSITMTEVVFFHRASRSAIFTDLIQRFDPRRIGGWRGWLMRLDGLVGAAVRAWDPQRVIIAHGMCFDADVRATLDGALAWAG